MYWQAKSTQAFALPSHWQQLQNGEDYCSALQDYFEQWFGQILGYQILKIGGLSAEIKCDLPLRHQIVLAPEIDQHIQQFAYLPDHSLIQATITEMPFIQQSINACLLINSLNFCADPHQILREVHRVLTKDGYLFISLFNPFSPLILKQKINKSGYPKLPFRQYLTARVIDWLALLNFDLIAQKRLDTHWGALIVLVAQKRTYSLIYQKDKKPFLQSELFQPLQAFKKPI